MTMIQGTTLDFLTLNDLVDDIVHFAEFNNYQQPMPAPVLVEELNSTLKDTIIVYEQIRVMPSYLPKASLNALASYYVLVVEGLSMLMMACPDPETALGWFDYQKQYKSRVKQLENLTILLDWQQSIYLAIVDRVPELPVPVMSSKLEQLPSSENNGQKESSKVESFSTSTNDVGELYL